MGTDKPPNARPLEGYRHPKSKPHPTDNEIVQGVEVRVPATWQFASQIKVKCNKLN